MQPRDNPDVQPQRPGYCLYSRQSGKWYGGYTLDTDVHTVRSDQWVSAGAAKVYAVQGEAEKQAKLFGVTVTSVPRWNGHCHEWADA